MSHGGKSKNGSPPHQIFMWVRVQTIAWLVSVKSPLSNVFASCGECAHAISTVHARCARSEKSQDSRKTEQKNDLDVKFHIQKANIQPQKRNHKIVNCRMSFRAPLSTLAIAVHETKCVN